MLSSHVRPGLLAVGRSNTVRERHVALDSNHRLILCAIMIAGCGGPQVSVQATPRPSPSAAASAPALPTYLGTDPVLADLTPYPSERLAKGIADRMDIGLRPLEPGERYLVEVDAEAAIKSALASRGVGNPGPDATGEIVWTSAGFVYLAAVTPATPFGPQGTPFPAYLVQVLAPEIPGFPGHNTALVVVDARTGTRSMTFSTCVGDSCGPP